MPTCVAKLCVEINITLIVMILYRGLKVLLLSLLPYLNTRANKNKIIIRF